MSNIKIHLLTANDTIQSLAKKYNCTIEDLKLLNPNMHNLHIGNILYIKDLTKKINLNYVNAFNHILYISRMDYISYINKFNDHILIEESLFNLYNKLSKDLFEIENEQILLITYLKNLHSLLHQFIDYLLNKNDNEIKNTKKEIQNNISNIYILLHQKGYDFNLEKITKLIENNMLIIAKILNNNYYESFLITKKGMLSHPF